MRKEGHRGWCPGLPYGSLGSGGLGLCAQGIKSLKSFIWWGVSHLRTTQLLRKCGSFREGLEQKAIGGCLGRPLSPAGLQVQEITVQYDGTSSFTHCALLSNSRLDKDNSYSL